MSELASSVITIDEYHRRNQTRNVEMMKDRLRVVNGKLLIDGETWDGRDPLAITMVIQASLS